MTHTYKAPRLGSGGCVEPGCGRIRGNEQAHGHTCNGKMILNAAGSATCYECGRTLPVGEAILIGEMPYARAGGIIS